VQVLDKWRAFRGRWSGIRGLCFRPPLRNMCLVSLTFHTFISSNVRSFWGWGVIIYTLCIDPVRCIHVAALMILIFQLHHNYLIIIIIIAACRPVARQRPANNRGMVFPTQSVPRCYNQDKSRVESLQVRRTGGRCEMAANLGVSVVSWLVSQWARELLRFSRCEPLLLEAGSWGQG
jgi:hypothetical protein